MDGRLESELRRLAWEYLERAEHTDDPRERGLLLERAALWHALATDSEQPQASTPSLPKHAWVDGKSPSLSRCGNRAVAAGR